MLKTSLELTDDLINEFVEMNKHRWIDPEQYPRVFMFMMMTFLHEKGLLTEKMHEN